MAKVSQGSDVWRGFGRKVSGLILKTENALAPIHPAHGGGRSPFENLLTIANFAGAAIVSYRARNSLCVHESMEPRSIERHFEEKTPNVFGCEHQGPRPSGANTRPRHPCTHRRRISASNRYPDRRKDESGGSVRAFASVILCYRPALNGCGVHRPGPTVRLDRIEEAGRHRAYSCRSRCKGRAREGTA